VGAMDGDRHTCVHRWNVGLLTRVVFGVQNIHVYRRQLKRAWCRSTHGYAAHTLAGCRLARGVTSCQAMWRLAS
jgi:hypothetical protein